MATTLTAVPRTSFRLPFGMGFGEPLKADAYDSENIVVGRTAPEASPSALYLGKLAEFEQMRRNVWLDCHGAHAVYVVGKRRSGKSYTLGAICEGLISEGWVRLGRPDQAVLLLDTLNIYGTLHVGAESNADSRLWQLSAVPASVRYVAPEVTRPTIAADSTRLSIDPAWLTLEDWCGFFEVDPFADPLGHLLGVVSTSVRELWLERDKGGAPEQGSGIEDCIRVLDSRPDALQFEESTREALRRRLLAMDRFGFLARPSPRVEELLAPGTITACLLRDLDDKIRALIVAVIVREVMRARARADASARFEAARGQLAREAGTQADGAACPPLNSLLPRCWIAIDEAHNYLPSAGSLPSRPVLRRLITEGRNIGLSVVVATQQPSGLDTSIQRNADALLIHSMSMREDIAAAEGMLNTQVPDTASWGAAERVSGRVFEKVIRALPQGYCLVSTDSANRIFGLRVRPRLTMHGGGNY